MEEKLLVRQESTTNEAYGKQPEERTVQELLAFGAVAIDKPSGPTSHQVSAYAQQVLGIEKAGHSGTLDPKVTGVLPIGTGRATRLLEYLLGAGKTYVGVMHLHGDVEPHVIYQAADKFIGEITQLPPKRSSVARRNRKRTIYELRFPEIRGRDILFIADVQAGTYIRKLCHDFGEALGVGAHMAELRRTRAAIYTEEQAVTLQTLSDMYQLALEGDEEPFRRVFLPAEALVDDLPKLVVLDSAVHSITQGATLKVPGVAAVSEGIQPKDRVQLLTQKNELIAVGEARLSSKDILGEKGVAAKPVKVFLDSSVYPRME